MQINVTGRIIRMISNRNGLLFPYETRWEEYFEPIPKLDEFKIRFYFHLSMPESKAVKCYFEDKKNFIGWFFPIEKLVSSDAKFSGEGRQKNLEAYMDIARHLFFNRHRKNLEKFENSFVDDGQCINIIDYLTFDYLTNVEKLDDTEIIQHDFKDLRESYNLKFDNLVIFIEDCFDSKKTNFNYENLDLVLMLRYQLFSANDLHTFHKDYDSIINSEKKAKFTDSCIILKNFSEDINDPEKTFALDVLPKFYVNSFGSELQKFMVLYQFIELFISDILHDLLEESLKDHRQTSAFKLKKEMSELFGESYRISKLFSPEYVNEFSSDIRAEVEKKYEEIMDITKEGTTTLENDRRTCELYKQIYQIRNTVFHNLRSLKDTETVEKNLFAVNICFEKIVAHILMNFHRPSTEESLFSVE